MKPHFLGLAALFISGGNTADSLPQPGYEWSITNWKAHCEHGFCNFSFKVDAPPTTVKGISIPPISGQCSGGSRRKPMYCVTNATETEKDGSILYSMQAWPTNHTFMVSYLFYSTERSKSFNVSAYGDAYLSQSWKNSTFAVTPSSMTETQTCQDRLAPCPAQSPPAGNYWPPDPSEYSWAVVKWNVSESAHTQDFNITGPSLDYGTDPIGGIVIPSFNAHCSGYGSYAYNDGYTPLRYSQCIVDSRWVTAGYWVRQPAPGSQKVTLGLVVRLGRGDDTMWDLFSTAEQAYTQDGAELAVFNTTVTKASQVANIAA